MTVLITEGGKLSAKINRKEKSRLENTGGEMTESEE
jgi:hypothetical protein